MDNVSHSLFALALARAGLNRVCPRATIVLLISANAPDLDIVSLAGGSLRYLEVHRGYTHSLLCLPAMALLAVLVTAALFRERPLWIRALLAGCAGVVSHLLLDLTNSYGIRLLLPFSSRWFHLDLNGLYDGFFLFALTVAALWPLLANLVSGEIGDRSKNGRGVALACLIALAVFECGRAVLHSRATGQLEARIYDEELPLQVAALPDGFNPFVWRGIVETAGAYRVVPILMSGEPDLQDVSTYYKPPATPLLARLEADHNFRFFQYFSRFPAWSFEPVSSTPSDGREVDLTDLRFGTPGGGSFHCLASIDGKGQILATRFTYSLDTKWP